MQDTITLSGLGPLLVKYEDDGDNFDVQCVLSLNGYGPCILNWLNEDAMAEIETQINNNSAARAERFTGEQA